MHPSAASFLRFSLVALLSWAAIPIAKGANPSLSYTLDLPFQANQATPKWLGHPVTPSGTFASLNLPVTSPEAGASLLVTLTFREKEGGFLRLIWKGAAGDQVLSSNFYEGVAMDNQRTLLIPASVVQGSGTLSLQVGDAVLNVQRIGLEWVEEHPALVSPERPDEEIVSRLGKAATASELDGGPTAGVSVSLDGSIVSVPVTSAALRIEQGVEFSLQLEGVPRAARLSFQESGLPWGRHLVLWINQQRAGTISPDVPDLQDAGFPSGSSTAYVGWRGGSIYLPVALLKAGLNAMQLSVENDAPGPGDDPENDLTADQPLALNHLVCQFDYTTPQAAPATPTASAAPSAYVAPMLVPSAPELLQLKSAPAATPGSPSAAAPSVADPDVTTP